MKRIYNLIIIITTVSMFLFQSCKEDDFGEVGEPFNKIQYIQGTWKCTNVTQLDEYAVQKDYSFTKLDITDYYNFTDITLSLNVDTDLQPTTFILNPSGTPNFIITTGTWQFNDYNYPSHIYLYADGSTEISSILQLDEVPRPETSNSITYKWTRYSGGKAILSYQYTLEKQ